MSDYEFEMPWPPTVNHYHQPIRVGKGARIIKGVKARQYAELADKYLETMDLCDIKLSERLSVHLTLHPPTLAKYDVDNRTKGVFDALSNAKFWLDDEQVDRLTLRKGDKIKGGLVVVRVDIIDE
jgi:crossover junction endodeoxyribonuclease RusA